MSDPKQARGKNRRVELVKMYERRSNATSLRLRFTNGGSEFLSDGLRSWLVLASFFPVARQRLLSLLGGDERARHADGLIKHCC